MSRQGAGSFIKRNGIAFAAALVAGLLFGFLSAKGTGFTNRFFSWRAAFFGTIGCGLLFLLISEKKLFQKEYRLLLLLSKQEDLLTLLLAVGKQVLLMAAFFALFSVATGSLSVTRIVFLGIAALTCSLAITCLPTPARLERWKSLLSYAVLVLYSFYILSEYGYTAWSNTGLCFFADPINQIRPLIHAGIVLLVIAEILEDFQRGAVICLIEIVLFFVTKSSGKSLMAEFFAIVLTGNLLYSPRATAKVFFFMFLGHVLFLGAGLSCGWIENTACYFDYAGEKSVYALGMGHSNLTALVLMSVLFLFWYLWLQDHPIATAGICWAFCVGVWYLTYSRTVVVVSALFPILNGIYRLALNKGSKWKICLVWVPSLLAVFSIVGMYWIPTQQLFHATDNLFLRFTFPYAAIIENGISFWGMNREIYIIDNVFLHTLIYFGMVSLALLVILLIWISGQYIKQKQWTELFLFINMMLYSVMENAFIHMPFGFVALLIARQPEQKAPSMRKRIILDTVRSVSEHLDKKNTVSRRIMIDSRRDHLIRSACIGIVIVLLCTSSLFLFRHLSMPYKFVDGKLRIDLAWESPVRNYYRFRGIGFPEGGYSWTVGHEVEVEIPFLEEVQQVEVRIKVLATYNGPQRYEVQDDEKAEIASGIINGEGLIVFPVNALGKHVRFFLFLPDAKQINVIQTDSDDCRIVSMQISEITIYPIISDRKQA